MKKIIFIFGIALLSINLISCNSKKTNKDTETIAKTEFGDTTVNPRYDFDWLFKDSSTQFCSSAGGIGNFLLSKTLVDSMITHFDTIYKRDDTRRVVNAFENHYWIDSCTVSSIVSFLQTSTEYDGVRIYFGCALTENATAYPNEQYRNKTTLFIFPTRTIVPADKYTSKHQDVLSETIPLTNCSIKSPYILPATYANSEIEKFGKLYRKDTAPLRSQKDSLSKGIWIDACVLQFIQALIRNNSNTLDGIDVCPAAYFSNFKLPIDGRFKPNQSTVLLVPTSPNPDGKNHEDNWNIIIDLRKYLASKSSFLGALNHGELCPNSCSGPASEKMIKKK